MRRSRWSPPTCRFSRTASQIDQMYPARWFFAKHEDEPTTEVAIRRAVSEDLYLVLGSVQHQHAGGDLQDRHQSARELDLVRVRGDGARHRARAAAGKRVRVRGGEDSRRRGRRPRCCCCSSCSAGAASRAARRESADGHRRSTIAARKGPAERDHLHVRHVWAQADR